MATTDARTPAPDRNLLLVSGRDNRVHVGQFEDNRLTTACPDVAQDASLCLVKGVEIGRYPRACPACRHRIEATPGVRLRAFRVEITGHYDPFRRAETDGGVSTAGIRDCRCTGCGERIQGYPEVLDEDTFDVYCSEACADGRCPHVDPGELPCFDCFITGGDGDA